MNYMTNMVELGVKLTKLSATKGGFNFVATLVNRNFVTLLGFIPNNAVTGETQLNVGSLLVVKGHFKDCKKVHAGKTHLLQIKVVGYSPYPKTPFKSKVSLTAISEEIVHTGVNLESKKYSDLKLTYLSNNLLSNQPQVRVWEPATKSLDFFTKGQLVALTGYITSNVETPEGVSIQLVPTQLTFLKDSELQVLGRK